MRRVGGLIGAKSMVNDVLGELFPTIDVENLPAELYALMGTRLGFGNAQVQAGAGVRPQLQLFNPTDSQTIVTVTRVIFTSTTDPIVSWALNTVPFATLLARGNLRDTRLISPAANRTVAELREQDTAVPVGAAGNARTLALEPLDLRDENGLAVLSPGFGFNIESAVVATFATCTFYWRERTMEDAEILTGG